MVFTQRFFSDTNEHCVNECQIPNISNQVHTCQRSLACDANWGAHSCRLSPALTAGRVREALEEQLLELNKPWFRDSIPPQAAYALVNTITITTANVTDPMQGVHSAGHAMMSRLGRLL
jgi:hypothetical protein